MYFLASRDAVWKMRAVAVLLPALYALLFAPLGFPDMDNGYLTSMAWRVLHGQLPHVDFIYVRPSLPIYLHSLTLWLSPETHLVVERALYYAMMSAAAYAMVRTLGGGVWQLLLAFVFGVHNFEAQPWHTTDGIFWGAMGVWLLANNRWAIGLLCCVAAALCKQPFYLLPFAAMLGIWLLHGKKTLPAIGTVLGLGAIILTGLWYLHNAWLRAYWQQTTGSTTLLDLWQAGFVEYFIPTVAIAIPLLLISRQWFPAWLHAYARLLRMEWIAPTLLLAVPIIQLMLSLYTQHHFIPFMGFFQGLWIFSAVCCVQEYFRNRSFAISWGLLLLLSWCAGISWGYTSTMLCAAPCLVAIWQYIKPAIGLTALSGYLVLNLFPTFDAPFYQLSVAGESISPTLTHMRISTAAATQARSFLALTQRYPTDSFVVFPAYPLAHLLAQRVPTFPADWHRNADLNWQKNAGFLLQSLHKNVRFAYIEKTKLFDMDTPQADCALGYYVRLHWQKVAETTYWEVYERRSVE